MKIAKYCFSIFFLILIINIKSSSLAITKNKIIVTVEDQVISSYDLKNKINTVLFLSNQIINQENINQTKKRALNSLIELKLKNIQVLQYQIQDIDNRKTDKYLNNLSSKYQTNVEGLKKIFENNNLDFDLYYEEVQTEFNWQQLIFDKFRDKINIDEKELDNEIDNYVQVQANLEEFKLAEIEIALKNNFEDKNTIIEINNQIIEVGFEKTALKYSIANSSLEGGNIGWISSKSLSKEFFNELNKMKIGDISKPFIQTNTATILKLIDKKTLDINNTDLSELREKIIRNKKNELLNLYSNNYMSKIKNNSLIIIK